MNSVRKSELVFLYDLAWANPNGDPNDMNKPRIDSESGINYVTDVRLKRTVRDELIARGYDVLIQDTITEEGDLADGKHRGMDFFTEEMRNKYKKGKSKTDSKDGLTAEDLETFKNNVKACIDIRMFGCVLPSDFKNANLTYTGPIQFKMGYSMHQVKLEHIKGTGAFSSGEGKDQKTFRQEYVLPYSLINFYGVINDRAAQVTGLTEADVGILLSAMWEGTKNLLSRTKVGQMPRILLRIAYQKPDFYIGGLDKLITFESAKPGETIRGIEEGTVVFAKLAAALKTNQESIAEVFVKIDPMVQTDIDLVQELQASGITVTAIA